MIAVSSSFASQMAMVSLPSKLVLGFSDRQHVLQFLFSDNKFINSRILRRKCDGFVGLLSNNRCFRVSCESKTEEVQIRKCSPFLEGALLSDNSVLASDEWKAVPDIWRSSAEKYGDRLALLDPYHDPPTNMTYRQLEQEILDFSAGLRVIGVKSDEKLALFADNSCRWLVADQGIMAIGAINVVRGSRSSVEEILQIYNHSESVALVVDNPELFNRIAETFCSQAAMRFVILLWGEKSYLASEGMKEVPVFNYDEIINLGQESRKALFDSRDAAECFREQWSKLILLDLLIASTCCQHLWIVNQVHCLTLILVCLWKPSTIWKPIIERLHKELGLSF